ncbi:porin [Vibrio hepatarius]|uniref:porin n=1 Tax=Vibrio hepatarius TaxID=171383 RepID=UPI001C0A0348|nr:porin [Vibrio hepatarius]MBU2899200.1 porin [Vibrio hepatarius]
MKIKLLAALVAATACGTNAFAAEVYNSEGTTLSIGGYVDVGVGEYDKSSSSTEEQRQDVQVESVSPRINIAGTQDIGNGVVVDMKGEWALNYLDGGDTSFKTRLGYIGATHEEMGRMVAGTQWSPYYDVGEAADYPIAFANDFLYDYQMGGARAERMVSYRNSYSFSDDGMVGFGLGWQGEETESDLDARMQLALHVKMMDFGLGYAYSGGDRKVGTKDEGATSHIFSLKYGSYGSGVYAAVVYGMNEYFYEFSSTYLEESVQLEGLLAYGMDNGLNVSVNYEAVDNDKTNKTLYSTSAIQFEYTVVPNFVTFAGYEIDLGDDDDTTKDDDKWLIGARYYL